MTCTDILDERLREEMQSSLSCKGILRVELTNSSLHRRIQPTRAARNNAITHGSLIIPAIIPTTTPLNLPAPEHPAKRLLILLNLRAEILAVPVFVVCRREFGVAFVALVDGKTELADDFGRVAIRRAVVVAGVVEVGGFSRAGVGAVYVLVVVVWQLRISVRTGRVKTFVVNEWQFGQGKVQNHKLMMHPMASSASDCQHPTDCPSSEHAACCSPLCPDCSRHL